MDIKRMLKDLRRRKKPASESQGSQSRPDTPSRSPESSIRGASPASGSPVALSALVFHPLIPMAVSPHADDNATNTAGATDNTWTNLSAFLDTINQIPAFAPLAAAIDNLSWFVKAHESAATTQKEYQELRTQLESLFKDLCAHFSGNASPSMTTSMLSLCGAIDAELREVYKTEDRNAIARHIQADQDLDKITGCYRRIQGHLERIMLNANLNIWRIVDQYAMDAKLDRLNPSMSACYDSAEANVVQRRECAPMTREQVLLDLTTWKDKSDGEKVCWINGMAGTGKTTIATSFCSALSRSHELGASFFCTRSIPACRNVNLILPTIAYQLARFSIPFRGELLQVLDRDPDVHTKVPRVQFQRMILEPLQKVIRSLPTRIVVVIDALDECEDSDGVEQVLKMLLEHAFELPIRFLVSSRPEYHIRQRIRESKLKKQLVLHELGEKMVKADIEKYLESELGSLSTPPTSDQLTALVDRAGALFIYAATVVRYIKRGESAERLEAVLKAPGPGQESSNKTMEIDRLYETVLTSVFGNEDLEQLEKERMKLVLHTVVCAQEPLTIDALASLLHLTSAQAINALKPLWSVLHLSEFDADHQVSTLHASFPDFMLDPKRSKQFTCNSSIHNGRLAELCLGRIGRNQPQFNICNLQSSYVFDEAVPSIDETVRMMVPIDLVYACQYWAIHLELGDKLPERVEMLHEFLSKRLLLWVEVMNLTKRISKSTILMRKAINWLQSIEHSESTMLLARDARRFVTMFATSPVSRSTPHLYVSMLASWPADRPVARCYSQQGRELVRMKGIEATERQLSLLSLISVGSEVTCVVHSHNGAFFAAGTRKGRISIWDAASCRMTIDPIEGHTGAVHALAISPDSTQICSGSRDMTICVWNPQNGRLIADPLTGHTNWVRAVEYSPDGSLIASGSNDGTVRIWDTRDWNAKGSPLDAKDGIVFSVVFSPNGSVVAAGSESLIHLWDSWNGQMIGEPLKGHNGDIYTLAFTPDGRLLISGSEDHTIRIWDVHTGETVFEPLREHMFAVDTIAVSPNGKLFASAARDDTMRLWDTQTWQTRSVYRQTGTIRSVAFAHDGSDLVSGSLDANVRVWEVQDVVDRQLEPTQSEGHLDCIRSVAFSRCGSYIVSGCDDTTVRIWDAQDGRPLFSPFKGNNDLILSVGTSTDGNHIYSVSADRMIHVWDRQTGQLDYSTGPIETDGQNDDYYQQHWPAVFLFDGRRTVCGSKSGRIYMWEDGKLVFELAGHKSAVYSIACSPDGRSFASGSDEGELIMWDGSSGKQLLDPFAGHTGKIRSIAFSPDGCQIASGSDDKTIRLWSTSTNFLQCEPLEGHYWEVHSVAFCPQGTYLVSGSLDMAIRVWDVASRTSIAVLKGHTDSVFSVSFSPDASRIVSGSAEATIRLWEAPHPKRALASPSTPDTSEEPIDALAHNPTPNWTMDYDGWVSDDQGCLLLWVPPDLRSILLRKHNTILISRQGCVELDFSEANIGERWELCYKPFQPASIG